MVKDFRILTHSLKCGGFAICPSTGQFPELIRVPGSASSPSLVEGSREPGMTVFGQLSLSK